MALIVSDAMKDKDNRERLLDSIQVLSNYFQKFVMLRHVFCEDKHFHAVSQDHLVEEFGHNLSLQKDRNDRPVVWDPILEGTASWFAWKMMSLDNDEKTVLVHFVLESSANVFFPKANQMMSKYSETNYFQIHSEADEHHEKMGVELLNNVTPQKLERLLLVQKQGWDVMNTICSRIAELASRN